MPHTHLSSTVYELYILYIVRSEIATFSYTTLAFNAPVEGNPLGQSSLFLVDELPDGHQYGGKI